MSQLSSCPKSTAIEWVANKNLENCSALLVYIRKTMPTFRQKRKGQIFPSLSNYFQKIIWVTIPLPKRLKPTYRSRRSYDKGHFCIALSWKWFQQGRSPMYYKDNPKHIRTRTVGSRYCWRIRELLQSRFAKENPQEARSNVHPSSKRRSWLRNLSE